MEEIRIQNWHQLNEELYADSWQEPLKRFRSNYAFRGQGDAANKLRTSLMRLGGAYERLELPLLRTFRRYARRDDVPGDSVWNWLALAQHHGLPTRLLDWTHSPYVALHYATQDIDCYGLDGIVWCVDYVRAADYLPDKLKDILADEDARVFTNDMLSRATGSLREFDRLSPTPFVAFFEPPSLDERIINQFALFSLMSPATVTLEAWLSEHPEVCRRLIIPAALKWEIRDKLDQANITERVLFPGLDGLSRWLKRYYSPRS